MQTFSENQEGGNASKPILGSQNCPDNPIPISLMKSTPKKSLTSQIQQNMKRITNLSQVGLVPGIPLGFIVNHQSLSLSPFIGSRRKRGHPHRYGRSFPRIHGVASPRVCYPQTTAVQKSYMENSGNKQSVRFKWRAFLRSVIKSRSPGFCPARNVSRPFVQRLHAARLRACQSRR